LSTVEHKAFEASIESDAATREDVLFWERTFGSLNASVSPQAPPDDMWERIEAGLSDTSKLADTSVGHRTDSSAMAAKAANDNIADKLRRSLKRWRMMAIVASLATIALAAFIVNGPTNPFMSPPWQGADSIVSQDYIAVVNANGDQPSLVINIESNTGTVTARSIGVAKPEGKSLELWYVPDGQKAVSVGLVGEGGFDLKDIEATDGDLLAISVEPAGGSPTGAATGPVIYTGKLIKMVK
jgi:anti-sigma-K factor RskA